MGRPVGALGLVVLLACLCPGGGGPAAAAEGAIRPVDDPGSPHGIAQLQALFDARRFQDVVAQGPDALARAEQEHGADSLEAAAVIDLLVQALSKAGKAGDPATTTLAERGVAIREARLGPDDPLVAASLTTYGMILFQTSRPDPGMQVLERALALREKAFGPNDPRVADTLFELGRVQMLVGNGQACLDTFNRALSIRQAAFGPDDLRVAQVFYILALRATIRGELEAATDLAEEALRIQEQAGSAALPDLAETLSLMGGIHHQRTELPEALEDRERALAIQRSTLPVDHPSIADSLVNIGAVHYVSDEPMRAVALWEEAVQIKGRAFGPDSPRLAGVLNNLGVAHLALGELDAAHSDLERSLAITEKAFGPDHRTAASALVNLGEVYAAEGDAEKAEALLRRALAIREKAFGPSHYTVESTLNALADLLLDSGDVAAAMPLIERVLATRQQEKGPDSVEVAQSLGVFLGRALVLEGRYDEATKAYERSIAIFRTKLGDEDSILEAPLAGLAFAQAKLGRRAEALDAALEAQRLASSHIGLALAGMTEGEALRYAARQVATGDLILSLASAAPASADLDRVWDTLLRGRALVLDELIERRQAVSAVPDEATAAAYRELERARKALAALLLETSRDPGDAYKAKLKAAQDADVAAERALAERSARFREWRGASAITLEQVRSALPKDAALVAFYRYEDVPLEPSKPSEGQPAAPPTTPSYVAFVLKAGAAAPEFVRLGPASVLEAAVANWAREIARAADSPARASEQQYRSVARALASVAWDPVATRLGAARMVFVVPDGALHRVNLATLPAGGSRYLLEDRRRLHYLSAERELARPVWPGAAAGMLALGNPAFDASPSALPQPSVIEAKASGTKAARAGTVFRGAHSRCATFSGLTFEELPAAAAEVREVSAAWGKTARGAAPAVLTGTDATEAAFKALAPGRKVLHLASHGFFLGADCASASDVAGGAFRPWSPAAPSAARAENPLLLSGIALAGANRRESAPPDGEDGVLTAEEVGALDLSGTEWVVLSGCDTGIGPMRSGEGVLGLSRAFRAAGARTLVLSLWPVDDESSRQWMRALYDLRFVQRRSTDDAVRGASLDVLRRRRTAGKSTHPLFWGGFIATGDWR